MPPTQSNSVENYPVPDPGVERALLTGMLRIRLIEERIVKLYPQQQMRCPVHLCIGQEAVPVGVCAHLSKGDPILGNHRAHGYYLAKGGDLKRFFAEIYGKATGCSKGRGGSMHLIDLPIGFLGSTPIVGGTIPVATGVAFAEKLKGSGAVTVTFLGDAAVEEGVFHEALNFAVLKKLPIIYVCENNFYSVYTPLADRQPARSLSTLAQGHGATAFADDGNDVLRVYGLMQKAVELVRGGQGPVFLEFATYRWREHCGPNYDNDIGYRDEKEFLDWKKRCPIERMKERLLGGQLLNVGDLAALEATINAEIDEAVTFAKSSPFPAGPLTVNDVYA